MKLNKGTLKGVKIFGSGPPTDSAYQQVVNSSWEVYKAAGQDGSLYNTFRFQATCANGFALGEFVRVPLDVKGNVLPGLTDAQVSGNLAGIKTILASQGYTEAQMEGDVDLATWICHAERPGHVKVTPGREANDREKAAKKAGGKLPRECYASIEWLAPEAWAYGKKVEGEAGVVKKTETADPHLRRSAGGLPTPP